MRGLKGTSTPSSFPLTRTEMAESTISPSPLTLGLSNRSSPRWTRSVKCASQEEAKG